jgi:hypothetical protein
MNDLEQLSDRLHQLAGASASAAPTQHLLERGRRARHRRAAVTSASLGVLALGAVTSIALATHSSTPTVSADRPPTVTAADPRTQLVAAITASQSTSYHFTLKDNYSPAKEGELNPATRTGVLRDPLPDGPGFGEQRLVDGVLYIGEAGLDRVLHWQRIPGERVGFQYDGKVGDTLTSSVDPGALLAALREEGMTVTQTGPKTFHFEYSPKLDEYRLSDHYSGDITVDNANRIAEVAYERVVDWTKPNANPDPPVHITVTQEFSDYGVPVRVETPKLG